MNNSKIVIDNISLSLETPLDMSEHLHEKESQLVKIIEAIERIEGSDEWSSLKSLIFNSEVENLERKLKYEAEQLQVNQPQINFIQGKLSWARKYADLRKLAESYRIELSNIKKLTQPTER